METSAIIRSVAGSCISFSYILVGNAITQSFMTVPALLVDFPTPGSPNHASRAQLLGRQWPLCWTVGNQLFRPISTLGFLGYAVTSYYIYRQGEKARQDWRVLAVSALFHLITIIHSAVNMQPLNDKLEALAGRASEKEMMDAETVARKWMNWNKLRIVNPLIAGTLALWQSLL